VKVECSRHARAEANVKRRFRAPNGMGLGAGQPLGGAKLALRLLALLASAACGTRDETFLAQERERLPLAPATEEAAPGVPSATPGSPGAAPLPGGAEPSPEPAPPAQPAGPRGPSDAIFERQRRVEVEVEIDPADWEKLSVEGIGMSEILFPAAAVPQVPPFTHFSARVRVDGVTYEDVDIRKKGYIGSLSVIRPSLKLDFERGLGGQKLVDGNRRMTLNNDAQDASHVRQCLSYDLFLRLGLPAPRCSYAHVVVNGVDLGTYTNVEPIAKPLLRRFFDDEDGNLYEGQQTDFNTATAEYLELETNEEQNDRSDVQALVDALALPDEQVLAALEPLVDLERFVDFWALETLLGHWDGYSGNFNNYFAYHDPTSDKFVFIPWGADQTFIGDHPNDNLPYEIAVYASGALSSRLYALPEQRARYRQRLSELLDTLWDVPALLGEAEVLSRVALDSDRSDLALVRSYVQNHGERLRAALAEPAPEWPEAPPAQPADECRGTFGEISAAFSTVWGSLADRAAVALGSSEPLPGKAAIEGSVFEGTFRAGAGSDGFVAGNAGLQLFAPQGDGFYVFAELTLPLELFEPGYHTLHSYESFGRFGMYQPDFDIFIPFSVIGDGGILLERASLEPGGAVTGSFTGTINYYACLSGIKAQIVPLLPQPAPEPQPEPESEPEPEPPATDGAAGNEPAAPATG
jgi:hypothetical protein